MKKLLIYFLLLLPFLGYSQTGVIGAIASQTKTGDAETIPPPSVIYDYYTSPTGTDLDDGTLAEPFSITRAAQVAVAGDRVGMLGGTYRTTVVPTNSGTLGNEITYEAIAGQTVIISGANDAGSTGWTVHSGQIYKKTITLPVNGYDNNISSTTDLMANQVFKDGVMQFEGRYPDYTSTADLLDKLKQRWGWQGTQFTQTQITDAALAIGTWGNLTGAKIVTNGWFISFGSTVTAHSGNQITFNAIQSSDAKFRKYWYITGKLSLLNTEREWHYESGTLYFWQAGGGSPTGVEYKARNWGFDLRGKSYIIIKGIQFFACEPATGDASTTFCTVDRVKASYMNHYVMPGTSDVTFDMAVQVGIKMIGTNNSVTNSEFQFAAGQVIWLGDNGLAQNNLIQDYDYEGNYGCAASGVDATDNWKVLNNTMYRGGRSCVDLTRVSDAVRTGVEIAYNHMDTYSMQSTDAGAIYAARNQKFPTGCRFHHNWIHGNKGFAAPFGSYPQDDGIWSGVYFDQHTDGATVDHNVLYDNAFTDFFHEIETPSFFFNNTCATETPISNATSYTTFISTPWDEFVNNIFVEPININHGAGLPGDFTTCLFEATNPLFLGTGAGGLAYRLQTGSPARNTGTVISGITTDAVGVPDIGAYEFGAVEWTAGYVAPPPEEGGGSGDGNIASLEAVSPITVAFNTDFGSIGLPSNVSATFEDASTGLVNLSWAVGTYNDLLNPRADEDFVLVGTPVEEGGVTNDDDLTVTCTVTVQDMYQDVTSTIAGIWDFSKLIVNTTNDYGTVAANGDITLVKSLAPGPTGRNYQPLGTTPKLVSNYANLIGTGAFEETTVNANMEFQWYEATAANLKYTEIIAFRITDTDALVGIAGNNGFFSGNNGVSFIYNGAQNPTDVGVYIGLDDGDSWVAGGVTLTPDVNQVVSWQLDNSLAAASKTKIYINTTLNSPNTTGSYTFSNSANHNRYNLGDHGTGSTGDMTGRYYYKVSLEGNETDAVRNKLVNDIIAYLGF